MASKPIYQIYAELEDYEPKTWRRFQVINDITVARLAYILMTLFEMQGSHVYLFEVNELNNFIINHLEHYDFGDNWCFNIILEKIFKDETISGRDLPRVIEGNGFGIIEDCGGTGGLENIREALKVKKAKIMKCILIG